MDTSDGRNTGECGVLALARVHGWTAILDDQAAYNQAHADHLTVHRTGKPLCDGIRNQHLTRTEAQRVADALVISGYRLPFGPGELLTWAADNRLL